MAESGIGLDQDAFCCSICLELLKEPVTIPCGHSYCMSCIHSHWDEELTKTNCSCPQCRQKFSQRPVLVKNTMLAVLMEGLKKNTALPSAAADKVEDSCVTKGDDVVCDLCNDKKQKAVKSCLQCLVSYCKVHLQPHYNVAALKKHKLVDPTVNLLEHICSRHDEVMKMFCRTDQQCICYLCSVDEHKGHDTVTAAAERAHKQKELETVQQKAELIKKTTGNHMNTIHWELKYIGFAADAAEVKVDKTIKELISHIEKKMTEVKLQIRSHVKTEESRLKDLKDKLYHDYQELQGKCDELEKLKHIEDHYQFLHTFSECSKLCEKTETSILTKPEHFRQMLPNIVSKLIQVNVNELSTLDLSDKNETPEEIAPKPESRPTSAKVPQVNKKRPPPQNSTPVVWPSVPSHSSLKPTTAASQPSQPDKMVVSEQPTQPVRTVVSQQPTQPKMVVLEEPPKITAVELERYLRDLTLDPRSLNNKLKLSRENTVVKHMPHSQFYGPHPFRFTDFPQVVSKENLTGRCFWRMTMKLDKVFTVAVAYKDIQRDGPSNECCFGKNAKSWALECFNDRCVFWHNGQRTDIAVKPCGRVGVFLDYKDGILSFYRSNDLQHIFTIWTSFTQPLVAGFRLDDVGSVGGLGAHCFY